MIVPVRRDSLELDPFTPDFIRGARISGTSSASEKAGLGWLIRLSLLLSIPVFAGAQTLHLEDRVATYSALTNTLVTLAGRAELRITGSGDPIAGSVIDLDSPDAWLLLTGFAPSQVAAKFLSRVRVNGARAVLGANARVVQYAQGSVVVPQGSEFAPLEVYDGRFFTGSSKRLSSYVAYDSARLGPMAAAIGSFRLKRGYLATLAQQENGAGVSRCYVAQDGDLEVGALPPSLQNAVRFVRVYPWRWVSKKGIAGNIHAPVKAQWWYNWNLDQVSPLDVEYVGIRQNRWWPGLDQDWRARGVNHLLGYNEPDSASQANLAVGDAIGAWPDLLATGLRVGSPAPTDGGQWWLSDFIRQADAAGLRVDFVAVHYYRCYGNPADPDGAAGQFYNYLKGIHDAVQRPLWVTEWNNGANWTSCADPSYAQQQATVARMVEMLETTPFVERYALYNWVEDVRRLVWDNGSLTPAGMTYRDCVTSLAYRQEMPDPGVGAIARYAFDGDTRDASGYGQDALRVGAPRFTAGQCGSAIALDGTTDYLQLAPRLGDTADWSFAGWVCWNGGGNWQRIFDFGEDTSHYLFLTPRSGAGTLRFAINRGDGEQQLNAAALVPGVWTHLAVTLAGNTGRLFVNGVPVATNTAMTLNPADVGTRFNFLGKSQFAADPLFAGRFDDFRFLGSALTEAQVAAIVATPPPQFRAATLFKPDAPIQQPYSATLAGDADGIGALTFGKMDGPAWLTIGADGSLRGTPSLANGGLNTFFVRVTDPRGSVATAALAIAVPTLSVAIASGADDAEQSDAGTVYLAGIDLALVNDSAGGAGDQIVGLRFTDLPIPRGAIIHSATIQFAADESQSAATVLNFCAEAADDAAAFAATANNLGARSRTSLGVPWQPAAWVARQSGAAQRSPNLAGLVQEVVLRPGWTPGNALVFLVSGSGRRTADSFDKAGGIPARLDVTFASPTPLYTATATVRGGADDAEQAATGPVNLTSQDLELVNDSATGAGDQTVGLRFAGLSVPAGSIIADAAIQFAAAELQSGAAALTLWAEAADNAAVFTSNPNNLTARPRTAAFVPWAPAAWATPGERGPRQRTPDLSPVVQEVTARPGWASGNAVTFLISGAGRRTAEAADKLGGSPATLRVHYWPEIPLGTWARWAAAHVAAGAIAEDRDGDGYNNLLEYALGRDPAVAETGATPITCDDAFIYLDYTHPAAVTDVVYRVEWADAIDTDAWISSGVVRQIISDDGVQRTIRAVLPRGASGSRFVRLRVLH